MDMSDPQAILKLVDLSRTFRQGEREIHVLAGADAELYPGEAVALVGPSGAGKSTLLQTAGLLETPDSGAVIINGRDCAKMNDEERTRVRRAEMGFVYQFHQLLPEFSAAENVMLPQLIRGVSDRDALRRAEELLVGLGLKDRMHHRPPELSGGEQQRTAIARALANQPQLILADEPTGNLDPETSERVFSDLMTLIEQTGVAALIATHNLDLAHRMHRVLELRQGQLHEMTRTPLTG
ncbi:MAG: ABC transporter ATP-binding protein [Pseudomonadota bacterium]